jgi:Z1 domain
MTGDALRTAVLQELKALEGSAPSELLDAVNFRMRKLESPAAEAELVDLLTEPDPNGAVKTYFRIQLSRWDATDTEDWTSGEGVVTAPKTNDRRHLVYRLLDIDPQYWLRLDAEYPHDLAGAIVIGAEQPWDPWHTDERRREHDFYWSHYRDLLLRKGWSAEAVAGIDGATTEVVNRLTDPTRIAPYQSKGLVVGYVQSGKTANFAGVIAKAIDAGYRLIIVLTGTVEILRSQTQRRLDMELVGMENIVGGVDQSDLTKMSHVDYFRNGDQDWFDDKFLRHGIDPVEHDNIPAIRRLTSPEGDYKALRAGLSTLDFRQGNELVHKQKPLYDPVNLFRTDVRIAVVKKHSGRLKQLVSDLDDIHARLEEIPALIIDDEADQASVNTVKPRTKGRQSSEERERSAINRCIAELLRKLKRCQYVGYTATPFANVFIDPDDSQDVFPKDFIISLDGPLGYMGGADFHDLRRDDFGAGPTYASSNEKAFVRGLYGQTDGDCRKEMQEALDAFVLSGAVKLYRKENGTDVDCRHHTMLVHESVKRSEHAALAGTLRTTWAHSGYTTPAGLDRLRGLWDSDYRLVCEARADGASVPRSFDDLRQYIGKTVDKIAEGTTPVLIVNGDKEKDYEQQGLDFQAGEVWKVLVGGAKLSRGFTVEGLTVSYYKRRAGQADTLMQAGRWFGFRPGYRDLVRLYIGRNVPGPRDTVVDLYEAFEGVVRDEEDFRAELRQYAALDDEGRPMVRPEDVPPMVFQQLPWLKPTQTNKMYNAELTYQGVGARVQDRAMQPERGNGQNNAHHFAVVQPLLAALGDRGEFKYEEKTTEKVGNYSARYGLLSAGDVADVLDQFRWMPNWSFQPHLEFLRRAEKDGLLKDWAILLPELSNPEMRTIGTYPERLPVITRKRRDRGGFSGSSFRQRAALVHIADSAERDGGSLAERLRTGTRGALLLNFAVDTTPPSVLPKDLPDKVEPRDIATLISYALPLGAAPRGRIGFKVRRKDAGPIIDRESELAT